jgi:hypothetical protein
LGGEIHDFNSVLPFRHLFDDVPMETLKGCNLGSCQVRPEDRNRIDVADSRIEIASDHRPKEIGADQIDAKSLLLAAHESGEEPSNARAHDLHPQFLAQGLGHT